MRLVFLAQLYQSGFYINGQSNNTPSRTYYSISPVNKPRVESLKGLKVVIFMHTCRPRIPIAGLF